jgi:hypothetical protein
MDEIFSAALTTTLPTSMATCFVNTDEDPSIHSKQLVLHDAVVDILSLMNVMLFKSFFLSGLGILDN